MPVAPNKEPLPIASLAAVVALGSFSIGLGLAFAIRHLCREAPRQLSEARKMGSKKQVTLGQTETDTVGLEVTRCAEEHDDETLSASSKKAAGKHGNGDSDSWL